MTLIILVLINAAAPAAVFFYVSNIISTPPKGRAEDYLKSNDQPDKKLLHALVTH